MIVLATTILGLAVAPSARLDLRLNDRWTYEVEQRFIPHDAVDRNEEEERFTYRFSLRVTGVKTDEYDLEARSRLVKHRFGGEDLPPSSGAKDLVESIRVRPDGMRHVRLDRFADPVEFRISRLTWFGFPSTGRPQNQWTVKWPGHAEFRVPAAEVSYRKVGSVQRLGRRCSQYEVGYRETGSEAAIAVSGRADVDEASGIVLRMSLAGAEVPIPGGTAKHEFRMELEVQEAKLSATG